MMRNIFSESG